MDPTRLLQEWVEEYKSLGIYEPEAAVLSTLSKSDGPSSRVVLIRQISEEGLVFFTNNKSKKAQDISLNNKVAVHFYFRELYRQVQIRGEAKVAPEIIADNYFSERGRDKQISAWASKQSEVLESEQSFISQVKEIESKFKNKEIKRPDFWSGYIVEPNYFEFWTEGVARRHRRLCYEKTKQGNWSSFLLYP